MSTPNYTLNLLGMEGVIIENYEESEKEIRILLSIPRQVCHCPACGAMTDRVHDYYTRSIRDLTFRDKPLLILYRQRRYVCPHCHKRFAERCHFASKHQHISDRVVLRIGDDFHKRKSAKQIAHDTATSVSAVSRVLNVLAVPSPSLLPDAISFDEFKGDADGQKFQCIVTNPRDHKVLDILPGRTINSVQDYLKRFPNRHDVKYVVMDMNRGFRNAARAFLPNSKIVIDRFHVVRFCVQAMDDVRREMQRTLPAEQRRYFKHSRGLLLAHMDKLSPNDRAAVDRMLRFSDSLAQAYALKEAFYYFMDSPYRQEADRRLEQWLDACDRLQIPQFKACRRMLINWREYILNAFDCDLSNGFTEGCNNAIKALKRVCFGFRKFSSLRKRILLSFN